MTSERDRHVRLIRDLWAAERFDDCVNACRDIPAPLRDDIPTLAEAAAHLGHRFETDEAGAVVRRIESIAPADPDTRFRLARLWEQVGREDEVRRVLTEILASSPAHAPSLLRLAEWCERRHRLDEAWALAMRATEVPDRLRGRREVIVGRLLRRRGDDAAASEALLRVAQADSPYPQPRVDAWYELASIRDRAGDADGAIDAAVQAKSLQRRNDAALLAQARAYWSLARAFVHDPTASDFASWHASGAFAPVGSAPGDDEASGVGLLTGPPRSGTSLLERVLGAHPGVVSADELDAWPAYAQKAMLAGVQGADASAALNAVGADRIATVRRRYLGWMRRGLGEPLGGRFLLDKQPSITPLIGPFRRLWGRAPILMALRDPRDVVISCYLCNLPPNAVSVMYHELGTTVERCVQEWSSWLELREKLPGPWVEVRYEDVVDDLGGTASRVLGAMGLGWDERVLGYRDALATRAVRSPTYEQLTAPVHRRAVGRWRQYERHLRPHLGALREVIRRLGYED